MSASPSFAERCAAIRASPRAVRASWLKGELWWLLDAHQYLVYLAIRAAIALPFGNFVLKWARRTGKTTLLILIALEESIRHEGHRYNVAAATKESLAEFVWPTVYFLLETCPEDLRPWIREAKGRVVFKKKSGRHSYIVLAGCNDRRSVERLRGPKSNGNIYEEIGAMPNLPGLRYVQSGVLRPQLLTTKGWELQAGTPPPSSGHEAAEVFRQAEMDAGHFSYATLYDNPRLTPEQVQQYLEADARGLGMTVEEYKASTDYRREWLALVETDPTLAVLPPCTPEKMWGPSMRPPAKWEDGADPHAWHAADKRVVRIMPDVPLFRDRYVSMDLGFWPHFTHVLFSYWDYARQVLVVEAEFQMRRLNDTKLARLIGGGKRLPDGTLEPLEPEEAAVVGPFGMEARVWGKHPPFLRVADNNYPMTLSELAGVHGLVFLPTAKDELEAAIIQVCRWIREGKIAVHPRCVHLIAQMQAAVWNKQRTEFAESKEFGHFDAVAALIYLVRNVVPYQSRVPEGWGRTAETWVSRLAAGQAEQVSADTAALRKAFGG